MNTNVSIKYAFTIKKNVKDDDIFDVLPSSYSECLDKFNKKRCKVIYAVYEDDKKGLCHVHGLVEIPNGVFRKTLVLPGYHYHLRQAWNVQGWEAYCKKCQSKLDAEDDDQTSVCFSVCSSVCSSDELTEPEDHVLDKLTKPLFKRPTATPRARA